MFKKPNKKFRSRRKEVSSDEEDNSVQSSSAVLIQTGSLNSTSVDGVRVGAAEKRARTTGSKGTLPKSSSVVSFDLDDGDEGEVFKIKKSSHSKKYTKHFKKKLQEEKELEVKATTVEAKHSEPLLGDSAKKPENNADQQIPNGSTPTSLGSDFEFDEEDDDEPSLKNMIQSGVIPDAATIHMIRKKRQLARDTGDFIPLEDTQKVDNTKSRLVRDDENDASEDEGRIDFSVGGRDAELRQMHETILAAREDSEGSDHDWEEQQIRKGVGITGQAEGEALLESDAFRGLAAVPMGFAIGDNFGKDTVAIKRAISVADLPQINTDLVRKRLNERLEELISVRRGHCQERDTLANQLESTQDQAGTCGEQTQQLSQRYQFFQETRAYLLDLVECLNEKVPKINFLEKSFLKLWQKQALKVVERRQQDIKDESQDCMTAMSSRAVTIDQTTDDQQKQRRVAEREARRNRRKRKRENLKVGSPHNDGLSTDDERNPSQLSLYQSETERLTLESTRLFEDVEDDYYEIQKIESHFESWRDKQPQTYYEAYVALCLPKLFTPFVKLKLCTWNPVEESMELETCDWHQSLLTYGHQGCDDFSKSNDDLKLLPSIIEKVLLPKLTEVVQCVWDPMSSRQTGNLTTLIDHLSSYPTLSSDSKHTKALVKAVTDRIRKTLDEDVFMPLYPKQMLESRGSAWVFFHRQLWSCIKLFQNITSWHGILSPDAIKVLALDSLLNRYILLGLQNCTIDDIIKRVRMIVAEMPKVWFTSDKSEDSIPQLTNFCRFLTQTCLKLDQAAAASGNEFEVKTVREKSKQIVKILVSIHAMDSALTLANHFSIKIAAM